MEISTRIEGDTAILEFEGSLVAGEAEAALAKASQALLGAGARALVVDLENLSFVDSAGLGALVQCYKDCERFSAEIRLRRVPEQLRGLLEIARLTDLLPIEDNDG